MADSNWGVAFDNGTALEQFICRIIIDKLKTLKDVDEEYWDNITKYDSFQTESS